MPIHDRLKPLGLVLRLRAVLLQARLHLRIILEPLRLTLGKLDRLHLERVEVAQTRVIDLVLRVSM